MVDTALSFPTYFPPNCPPSEASDEECVLYRFCKADTLDESDFLSYFSINPEKYKNNINAYGLSTFKTIDACKTVLNKAPKLRNKYKYIASGMTNEYRGKILQTPSNTSPDHYTWWVYEGVKPHTFFEVYGEGGDMNG